MYKTIARANAMLALTIGMFFTAVTLQAQAAPTESLEQTYGRLCGNGQQSETCTALRQALKAKLGPATATAAASQSAPLAQLSASDVSTLERACESGNGAECQQLAIRYYSGQGLPLDLTRAASFFQRACELGQRGSCAHAGGLYLSGKHSPSDPVRLASLVAAACEADGGVDGCSMAAYMYSSSYSNAARPGVPVDDAQAARYFQRACDLNHARSCLELASMYGWGKGVTRNPQTAMKLYDRGCATGNPQACTTIGLAYEKGNGVPKDRERALGYYGRGCESPVTAEEDPNEEKKRSCRWLATLQAAPERSVAQEERKGGGLFRAALGAGLGMAAAKAGGMDAEQTIGAAAKGVALMNPESQVAQAVGAAGDAVLQNSGLGTAAGGTSAGGSAGAKYPTKPNVLNGQAACSIRMPDGTTMNEGNYRQVDLSGNDVQLKTMCAQAYEYYSMYKRAIAQGYSEADSNRTFAAHEKAARVAISFHAGAR